MNRTQTAAVALAAALGMAGMAQAQMNSTTNPPSSPMTTAPSASQPGMSGAPTGSQNPATMTAPGSTSTHGASPQANSMNMSPQGGATQPASQSQIFQAQQQLKSAGLYRGAVDGVMGPETQTALVAFQREQGLPETAQLDQQTLDRLSSGGSAGSSSPTTPRSGTTPSMSPGSTTGGSSTGTTGASPSGSYNR
jgi:peptidoglycan hydrolase-like protein with peptidoglycan-binding domain